MHVPAGSIYALIGPNGAGKTTTLSTVMNLREPDAGSARVLGRESRQLGPADFARIGYVSEGQHLPEHLRIAELEAYCRPFYPTWDSAFAAELRARFDLDPRAAHPLAVARHAPEGGVPGRARAAPEPAGPRRAVQRPRSRSCATI